MTVYSVSIIATRMVAATAKMFKSAISRLPKLDPLHATHRLHIPLYNSRSKEQLGNFAEKLANDEFGIEIPQKLGACPARSIFS